jgi:hypothetical protein
MQILINFPLAVVLIVSGYQSMGQEQQRDTSLQGHTITVKGKHLYKLPVITDSNFCNKLKSIKTPADISFVDTYGGNDQSYFLTFAIIFKTENIIRVEESKNKRRDKSIDSVIANIKSLLKHTKWKVYGSSLNHQIEFSCILAKTGLGEATLESRDNFDILPVCR